MIGNNHSFGKYVCLFFQGFFFFFSGNAWLTDPCALVTSKGFRTGGDIPEIPGFHFTLGLQLRTACFVAEAASNFCFSFHFSWHVSEGVLQASEEDYAFSQVFHKPSPYIYLNFWSTFSYKILSIYCVYMWVCVSAGVWMWWLMCLRKTQSGVSSLPLSYRSGWLWTPRSLSHHAGPGLGNCWCEIGTHLHVLHVIIHLFN